MSYKSTNIGFVFCDPEYPGPILQLIPLYYGSFPCPFYGSGGWMIVYEYSDFIVLNCLKRLVIFHFKGFHDVCLTFLLALGMTDPLNCSNWAENLM